MHYISVFLHIPFFKNSLSPPRSSSECDVLIEGPLILISYGKILLDFSVALRMDSERLSAKFLLNEVEKVMES